MAVAPLWRRRPFNGAAAAHTNTRTFARIARAQLVYAARVCIMPAPDGGDDDDVERVLVGARPRPDTFGSAGRARAFKTDFAPIRDAAAAKSAGGRGERPQRRVCALRRIGGGGGGYKASSPLEPPLLYVVVLFREPPAGATVLRSRRAASQSAGAAANEPSHWTTLQLRSRRRRPSSIVLCAAGARVEAPRACAAAARCKGERVAKERETSAESVRANSGGKAQPPPLRHSHLLSTRFAAAGSSPSVLCELANERRRRLRRIVCVSLPLSLSLSFCPLRATATAAADPSFARPFRAVSLHRRDEIRASQQSATSRLEKINLNIQQLLAGTTAKSSWL